VFLIRAQVTAAAGAAGEQVVSPGRWAGESVCGNAETAVGEVVEPRDWIRWNRPTNTEQCSGSGHSTPHPQMTSRTASGDSGG